MIRIKFMAEISSNHLGQKKIGMDIIDNCIALDFDLIKMQLWNADELYKDNKIYSIAKKVQLSKDDAIFYYDYAKEHNANLSFSTFNIYDAKFCESLDVKFHKIAFRMSNNKPFVDYIRSTNKMNFITFGNDGKRNIKEYFEYRKTLRHKIDIPLYTTPFYPSLSKHFDLIFLKAVVKDGGGFSNHYTDINYCKEAINHHALWIEIHVMPDELQTIKSPDACCSLTYSQIKELFSWVKWK
jgi:sialic acid synthase SpsE